MNQQTGRLVYHQVIFGVSNNLNFFVPMMKLINRRDFFFFFRHGQQFQLIAGFDRQMGANRFAVD